MGGYGAYVWGSYAVTFVLLLLEVIMVVRRKRAVGKNTNLSGAQVETQDSKLETVL